MITISITSRIIFEIARTRDEINGNVPPTLNYGATAKSLNR
jgi:hypothetical protein